ncbi:HNH endonuclease [Bacillus sp. S13(2024)]|uniref:HNH endonuclease n=1 Tax=unclassified Bacillus (in: firmicutes) TaxID=185979 RepID=UPI003D1C3122
MRPIDKGNVPLDKSGKPIQFTHYKQSKGHLMSRIGSYCSYCERSLSGNVAVEHVLPKTLHKDLELEWDNFLLACNNCNSTKGHKPVILDEYLWPDKDNTFLAFEYGEGGLISISSSLAPEIKQLAENIVNLVGLDRCPSLDPLINPEMSDTRWRERRTTFDRIKHARQSLIENDTISTRELIVHMATATGFFSTWMSVFKDDSDMLRRFIQAFPGTSSSCFDAKSKYIAINRSGGRL